MNSVSGFEFMCEDHWPALAWIAQCVTGDPIVRILHGPRVEILNGWFFEGVWAGDFVGGDFDRTDVVFGSGARIRDGHVVFVSSGATVDRLQLLWVDDILLISNSLSCLLAVGGVEVNATYDRFPEVLRSITNGIDSYERRLPTVTGRLELVFFRNLVWDGERLTELDKPAPWRDFSSFAAYHRFLASSLQALASNMQAETRAYPYEWVAGLSSGYDSTTTAVLARDVGLNHVFSFRSARGGDRDDGRVVAEILGLELVLIDRHAWRQQPYAEVPYFAAEGTAADVVFSAVEGSLRHRVLLTGFHGDKVWGKDTTTLGPDLVRADASGLSFTEHRLSLGCIHVPVPFIGARQIRDIHALSRSVELAPWDIPGSYSRPICRRICEDAGIPREVFGTGKKAATASFRSGEALLTRPTRTEFRRWLRRKRNVMGARAGAPSRILGRLTLTVCEGLHSTGTVVNAATRVAPTRLGARLDRLALRFQHRVNRHLNLSRYVFPWAVEKMTELYARTPSTLVGSRDDTRR